MRTWRLTTTAAANLQDVYDYIAERDGMRRADRVLAEFRDALTRLGDMPGIGHHHPDLEDPNLRVWTVHSWHVIYDPRTSPITILRIHSAYRRSVREED